MTAWVAVSSSLVGGALALAGVVLTQLWSRRRDHEARLWQRRADAYVALVKWRMTSPDPVAIADPRLLAEIRQPWGLDAARTAMSGWAVRRSPGSLSALNRT
jgi:hypothetical protein